MTPIRGALRAVRHVTRSRPIPLGGGLACCSRCRRGNGWCEFPFLRGTERLSSPRAAKGRFPMRLRSPRLDQGCRRSAWRAPHRDRPHIGQRRVGGFRLYSPRWRPRKRLPHFRALECRTAGSIAPSAVTPAPVRGRLPSRKIGALLAPFGLRHPVPQ